MIWTAEAEQRVRDGLAAGLSYLDLARQLGTTRGAIAGRARRLGIKTGPRRGPVKLPRGSAPIPLMKLKDDSCRYPVTASRFCGRMRTRGTSYCPEHARLCLRHPHARPYHTTSRPA